MLESDVTALETLLCDVAVTLRHVVTQPGPLEPRRVVWPEMKGDWYAPETTMVRAYQAVDIDVMDEVLVLLARSKLSRADKKIIWLRCTGASWRRIGHVVGRSHEWCRRRYLPGIITLLVDFKQKRILLTEVSVNRVT